MAPAGQCRAIFVCPIGSRFDFSDLGRYALNQIYLFPRSIFADEADRWEPIMATELRVKLSKFRPMNDYLVLAGDPLLLAATCSVLGAMVKQYTVLKYDGVNRAYWPFIVRHT